MSRRGPRRKGSDSLPSLPRNGLRIVPLGGLGEIGRNMTVFEHQGRLLIVDCGVLFPDEHQPGVDVIIPDFTWIRDRLDKVDAIVLTHGHEDHIGGVPYLLRERPDIPVVGSRLTLALLESKLAEHRITPRTVVVAEEDRRTFGSFDCEFVAVNHSIPDGLAVAIRTSAGLVLHTGDFKMDQFPLDRRVTDLRAFARLGEEGVDLFLVDSTNAEVPGFTVSEGELAPAIDTVFRTTTGRVIVSSFASHVHRIQQILDTAQRHGRKVAFVGRSMVRNMGIARELGYLTFPDGLVVKDLKALERLRPDQMAIIATGSQGEPMAALARMANRDHPVSITEGDTVLMASSLIPGNENAIYRVINELTRWGATVVHKGNAKVHVSGHASAGELAYCFNIIRPSNVLPVHGEWRHLRANADIAIRTGVDADRVLIAMDGSVIDLVDGRATHHRQRPRGPGVRRRDDRRRRHRGDPARAAHPGRGGRGDHRVHHRPRHRQAHRGPRLPCPRLPARGDGLLRGHAGDPGRADQGGPRRHRGPGPDRGARAPGRLQLGPPGAPSQPADHPRHRRRLSRRPRWRGGPTPGRHASRDRASVVCW